MEAQEESEAQVSETVQPQTEEGAGSQRGYKERKTTRRWKKAAFILGVAAVLLLAGLATSLGVFLTKTECGPPPRRENATTTYLGSASPGTEVTYVCQSPLLFPENSRSFTLACRSDLRWDPKEVPSCGIYGEKLCSFTDLSLTIASRPSTTMGLEIQITFEGSSPPVSMQVDIPTEDEGLCSHDGAVQDSTTSPARRQQSPRLAATAYDGLVVVVVFESVDPWEPYEVRLRSVGPKLAVTVLQGDTTTSVLTSFPVSSR